MAGALLLVPSPRGGTRGGPGRRSRPSTRQQLLGRQPGEPGRTDGAARESVAAEQGGRARLPAGRRGGAGRGGRAPRPLLRPGWRASLRPHPLEPSRRRKEVGRPTAPRGAPVLITACAAQGEGASEQRARQGKDSDAALRHGPEGAPSQRRCGAGLRGALRRGGGSRYEAPGSPPPRVPRSLSSGLCPPPPSLALPSMRRDSAPAFASLACRPEARPAERCRTLDRSPPHAHSTPTTAGLSGRPAISSRVPGSHAGSPRPTFPPPPPRSRPSCILCPTSPLARPAPHPRRRPYAPVTRAPPRPPISLVSLQSHDLIGGEG